VVAAIIDDLNEADTMMISTLRYVWDRTLSRQLRIVRSEFLVGIITDTSGLLDDSGL